MMNIPPIIKYTGSKRQFFKENSGYIPQDCNQYIDPFIGGGSSIPYFKKNVIAGDLNSDVINLWNAIKLDPEGIKKTYYELWTELKVKGKLFYYEVRDRFNKTKDPAVFLFLTRTCRNGLIRFNKKGGFNASFHLQRDGIQPERLFKIINLWAKYLRNVLFLNQDYREVLKLADNKTFVFLDPPYFSRNPSSCYLYGTFDFDAFFDELRRLNSIGAKWLFTFDSDEIGVVPKDVYTRVVSKEKISHFLRIRNKNYKKVYSDYFNFN